MTKLINHFSECEVKQVTPYLEDGWEEVLVNDTFYIESDEEVTSNNVLLVLPEISQYNNLSVIAIGKSLDGERTIYEISVDYREG